MKKEMIDNTITLVTFLMCNIRSRNGYKKKLRVQVDEINNQRYQTKGIPSVSFSFIPYQEVKKWKGLIFSIWNLVSKLWLVLRTCSLLMRREFTFNPIQDGSFQGCLWMGRGRGKTVPFPKIWHSYTLPKEHLKNI